MKKLLLGSTAIVAGGLMAEPALAADPIKINVGGYYMYFVNAGAIEGSYSLQGPSTQYKGLSFFQEGEIFFTGQTKLDNGTTIGLNVELEGWDNPVPATNAASVSSYRHIDEAFLFAFGDWGRIEIGSRDPAAYRMYYGVPSAVATYTGFLQHNTGTSWGNQVVLGVNKAAAGVTFNLIEGEYQDTNRINYFTPRLMGLQIGVSYTPKMQPQAFGAAGLAGPGANAGGVCGFSDSTAQAVCPTNDYSWQDAFDIGANYLNKFGEVSVALYGAFAYASFVPGFNQNAAAANLITGANVTAWKQWVVGAQAAYAGFTIGGSVGYDNLGFGSNYYTGVDNDNRKYSAGIMYETGPWQVSAGWAGTRNNNGNGSLSLLNITNQQVPTLGAPAGTSAAFGTNPNAGALQFGMETADKFEVGANYALGPGIKLLGGVSYYNFSGPSNAVAAQSWVVFSGIDVRF
jgi:hypothetical protein